MSNFKRAAVAAAAMMVLSPLAACGGGGGGASAGGPRIGVTVYGEGNLVKEGKEGMEAYAKARGIDLLWNSADGEVNKQANQIEQMITARVDAIIIVPVQYDSLQPQLQHAKDAGIPVIAVNTTVKNKALLTTSVLPDDVAAGTQDAQMMVDHLGGKGNVVMLQCVLGSSYELDRTKGMMSVLDKNPGIKLLAKGEAAKNGRAEGAARMKNWLTAFPKIDGVMACGDDMGLGAVQASKEAGKKIPVTGIDGIADGLEATKNGDFVGTQLQDGRVELGAGLAVANLVVHHQPVETAYVYKMVPVDAHNVDTFTAHVVTQVDAFLKTLPDLLDANVKSGDIANESTK